MDRHALESTLYQALIASGLSDTEAKEEPALEGAKAAQQLVDIVRTMAEEGRIEWRDDAPIVLDLCDLIGS